MSSINSSINSNIPPSIPTFTRAGVKYELLPGVEKDGVPVEWSSLAKVDQNIAIEIAKQLSNDKIPESDIAKQLSDIKTLVIIPPKTTGNQSNTIAFLTNQAVTLVFKPESEFEETEKIGRQTISQLEDCFHKAETAVANIQKAGDSDPNAETLSESTLEVMRANIENLKKIHETINTLTEKWKNQDPTNGNTKVRNLNLEMNQLIARYPKLKPHSLQDFISVMNQVCYPAHTETNDDSQTEGQPSENPQRAEGQKESVSKNTSENRSSPSNEGEASVKASISLIAPLSTEQSLRKEIDDFYTQVNSWLDIMSEQDATDKVMKQGVANLEVLYQSITESTLALDTLLENSSRKIQPSNTPREELKKYIEEFKEFLHPLPDFVNIYGKFTSEDKDLLRKIPDSLWNKYEAWCKAPTETLPTDLLESFFKALNEDPAYPTFNRQNLAYLLRQLNFANTMNNLEKQKEKGPMEEVD